MRCRSTERAMSAYLDGELSQSQWAPYQRHIHGCESCRERLQQFEHSHMLITSLPEPALPQQDIWQQIESNIGSRASGWVPMRFAWIASLCVLVAMAYFLGRLHETDDQITLATHPAHKAVPLRADMTAFMRDTELLLMDVKNGQSDWNTQELAYAKTRAHLLQEQVFFLKANLHHRNAHTLLELVQQVEILLFEIANINEGDTGELMMIQTDLEDQRVVDMLNILHPKVGDLLKNTPQPVQKI